MVSACATVRALFAREGGQLFQRMRSLVCTVPHISQFAGGLGRPARWTSSAKSDVGTGVLDWEICEKLWADIDARLLRLESGEGRSANEAPKPGNA